MSKPKRSRPVEEYQARWDKSDDIFEVVSDMFGHGGLRPPEDPVTSDDPVTVERIGPATSRVTGGRGWSKAGEVLPGMLGRIGEAPDSTTQEQSPIKQSTAPTKAPRRARTVQDGQSMAEQLIYDTLWREARIITAEYREITIGYRALAEKARLHRNTIDRNLESLQAKLAIEIIKPEDRAENIGRTYRVYGFQRILQRRETAGLIWTIKDRSGVRLFKDVGDSSHTTEVTGPVTSKGTGPVTSLRTAAVTPNPPGPVTSEVPPIKEEENSSGISSTSAVAAALSEVFGYADDDAARRIVANCRQVAPDATDEELADLTRLTARRLRSMRNLTNPMGLLIIQVAKCFGGESFRLYRQSEIARKEEEIASSVRIANAVLMDVDSSEDQRNWASGILANNEPQGAPTMSAEKNPQKP